MALTITDQNFESLASEGKLIVVDFWATWCGPCMMVGPIIEELAKENEGRAIVGKCDVDANSDLPGRFGIRNIPTVLFIKGGQVVDKLVGAQSKQTYQATLDKHL
ncbi:thioredoxin [Porphyromonas sp. COT-239 OH1446]|uniref:thioredoxin n=1 Tax=Porphyromonas sp. COT-239 OH1446 TaxID=1515613 RepID=UPI00052CFC63|nr:thioredoxin [Porphyromonas sp. COT-239 OH1446]KGN72100.1 thioredoxin [Porphyromonas sp. COT-239 OH1446]